VLENLCHLAIVINAGIMTFTMVVTTRFNEENQFWIFIGFIVVCGLAQWLTLKLISDEPVEVLIQRARKDHVKQVLFDFEKDEEEEDHGDMDGTGHCIEDSADDDEEEFRLLAEIDTQEIKVSTDPDDFEKVKYQNNSNSWFCFSGQAVL